MPSLKIGVGVDRLKSKNSFAVRNFAFTFYDPDGVDTQELQFSWTANNYETEIEWRIVGGEWALLSTIAPNVGVYTYDLFVDPNNLFEYGLDYELEFRARTKQDTTVLNIPTGLAAAQIITGARITGNVNNTEAQYIKLEANIDNAGYAVVATIAVTGVTFTYDHTVVGTHTIKYRARAMEGTLPIYSDYCSEITFNNQVTDQDGNVYTEVVIGTQTWLVENYKCTKYADGTTIPNLTVADDRKNDISGCMSWYDNDINNKPLYGGLYSGNAVINAAGFGIPGYRVAINADYTTMYSYLGGNSVAGGKMKQAGTTYWTTPNTGADNSSGFTARGGGRFLGTTGAFGNIKDFGMFWSTVNGGAGLAYAQYLYYASAAINAVSQALDRKYGLSIRLIKI